MRFFGRNTLMPKAEGHTLRTPVKVDLEWSYFGAHVGNTINAIECETGRNFTPVSGEHWVEVAIYPASIHGASDDHQKEGQAIEEMWRDLARTEGHYSPSIFRSLVMSLRAAERKIMQLEAALKDKP